ncbi:MAG: hypothetical protein GF317_21965 [Candidatus Lokiarchaeota archaeon]|nr:hypothetical protein [Candidatus Lokiarchaeota archaeon]MBD3202126.1 hypothetical protein [Candidatus Lokiarchaeota archaeon]
MIFQISLEHDLLLLFHYFAIFTLIYLVFQIGKKIKEGKTISMTTGFTVYMISYTIFVYFTGIPAIYPDLMKFFVNYIFLVMNIYILGMITYIFFSELEDNLYKKDESKMRKFNYPLTIVSLIGFSIFVILGLFGIYDPIVSFFIVIIPFIIATDKIIRRFANLEVVKRVEPGRWFYTGLTLTGISNAISSFWMLIGEWFLIIRYITVIVGSLLMVYGWRLLPNLSELGWMRKMEQLFVIHSMSSSLLFRYDFKTKQEESNFDSDLAGSAMGGVDMLLSEILENKGHIKEIEHEDKKLFFSNGKYTTSILITEGHSDEFRYRLDMFELNFEKEFGEKQLKKFSGEITSFNQADGLIREFFSH